MSKVIDILKPFTVSIDFLGVTHSIKVYPYNSVEAVRIAVRNRVNVTSDTIAYSETYSLNESKAMHEPLSARIYITRDCSISVLAHEATHVALGILNRHGWENIPATTEAASKVEEYLCELVGSITQFVKEDLS